MNFNLTVFRKSPATILIALAVVLLFLLAFWFGIAMVPEAVSYTHLTLPTICSV